MSSLESVEQANPITFIDPVCGMRVFPERTKLVSVYKGRSYWFCAEGCREAFEQNPGKFLEPKPRKRLGWVRRFLDRLARANKQEFGSAGPKCH